MFCCRIQVLMFQFYCRYFHLVIMMFLKYAHKFFDSSLPKDGARFSSSGMQAGLRDSHRTNRIKRCCVTPSFYLASFLLVCFPWNPATMLWGSPVHTKRKGGPSQQPAPTARHVREPAFESSNPSRKQQEQRQAASTGLCRSSSPMESMSKINGCFMPLILW